MAVTPASGKSADTGDPSRLTALAQHMRSSLSESHIKALSGGAQALLNLSEARAQLENEASPKKNLKSKRATLAPTSAPSGYVNDPNAAEDSASRMAGMTQNETSVAWCGNNAVVGYNDSGSLVATQFLPSSPSASGSLSFNGWSRSTNAGTSAPTYTDMGALVADPLPAGVQTRDLLGDPVLGCTTSNNFYYAGLAIDTPTLGAQVSGISLSRSFNAGTSFSTVMAVSKTAVNHFLDKPWLAVSPGPTSSAGDDVLHVSYTDFEFAAPECAGADRTAIEYVRSTNSGTSWSAPTVVEEVCGADPFVQGSQIEVGSGGNVYIAWENYANFQARSIRLRKSSNSGASFDPTRFISGVAPIGDGRVLQGQFRSFLDLQGLAVNKTTGDVHVTWHDGRVFGQTDPLSGCQNQVKYCFGSVLSTRSTDGAVTWSAPVRVNNDSTTSKVDHFFPALDIDEAGTLWSAFYDRRLDTLGGTQRNFRIDTRVAKSTNSGATWSNDLATTQPFAPITGAQDVLVNPIYMGDYISIAVDTLGTNPGVITAWGDNLLGDANVRTQRRLS